MNARVMRFKYRIYINEAIVNEKLLMYLLMRF